MIEQLLFLPEAPILDPALAQGASGELENLRCQIDQELKSAAASTTCLMLYGSAPGTAIGKYLLSRVTPMQPKIIASLEAEPVEATTLIVMGDGSARRSVNAPGYIDSRAHEFDDKICRIFQSTNLAELAELDQELGEQLLVAGIAPWIAVGQWNAQNHNKWELNTFHFEDPYGVAYLVASYSRRH